MNINCFLLLYKDSFNQKSATILRRSLPKKSTNFCQKIWFPRTTWDVFHLRVVIRLSTGQYSLKHIEHSSNHGSYFTIAVPKFILPYLGKFFNKSSGITCKKCKSRWRLGRVPACRVKEGDAGLVRQGQVKLLRIFTLGPKKFTSAESHSLILHRTYLRTSSYLA